MTSDATSLPTPVAAAVVLTGVVWFVLCLASAVLHKDEQ